MKELPTVIKQAEPKLTMMLKHEVALARQLKLRELQTSFVYSTVLAKKSKVKLRQTRSACLTHFLLGACIELHGNIVLFEIRARVT